MYCTHPVKNQNTVDKKVHMNLRRTLNGFFLGSFLASLPLKNIVVIFCIAIDSLLLVTSW